MVSANRIADVSSAAGLFNMRYLYWNHSVGSNRLSSSNQFWTTMIPCRQESSAAALESRLHPQGEIRNFFC